MAGRLTERLEVSDMTKGSNDFGRGKVGYVKRDGFIRAELRKQTGRQLEQGGEVFAAYAAEFNIRDRHQIKEGDRVRHLCPGGFLYKVENILWNRQKCMKTLQCSKVHE